MDSVDSQVEETATASLTRPDSKRGPKGDWRSRFLVALSQNPTVAQACKRAQISRETAYQLRANDLEFAVAWQAALEAGYDKLEEALYERAVSEDTQAAIFLLKGYRRNLFFERHKVEVGSPGDFEFDFSQLSTQQRETLGELLEMAKRK